LTTNREVLLTRREKRLYVRLCAVPTSTAVILYPIAVRPRRATLLNTGDEVGTRVELLPSHHEQRAQCLRLRNVPVNDRRGAALVVKREFDPGALPAPPG
jgi:alpha-L-fucosidase